jgi:hypothetical protein
MNLRERAELDLATTLEGGFSLPVELVDPDGNEITTSLNGGDLRGQIIYDTTKLNPDTGEEMVINKPVVSLRRSSLARVPAAGENWFVRIPVDPKTTADKESFVFDPTRPPEGGRSLGFIRIYLRRAEQSS